MANPVDAYRKLQKKREKEKNKRTRQEVREDAKLVQDPDKLKKELDELSHKSIIGRIDEAATERKAKLERLWAQHVEKTALGDTAIDEHDNDSDTSESESSSSDDVTDDEETKCVIHIAGKGVVSTKKQKEERLPDDFALELLKNAPPVPVNEVVQEQPKVMPPKYRGNKRPNVPIHKPYPPTGSHLSSVNHPPPDATPNKKVAIEIKAPTDKEVKSIPLSSYFVPNQLRINQGKK
ncbi:WW domain binding protein 11 family protein [Babesia bovis T2Bo]|uniref:WW domain binding protein 11 family protein n=1 Tax=Babesia bovis T2Bo TaxID=484906 RepID=UPI001D4E830C|nr:WW domain binding protein 11 family protein [Babesia bovis T2Bo]EDO06958.2 WW domain binding protein 11 family protein [Babesia bovis T2Bo]